MSRLKNSLLAAGAAISGLDQSNEQQQTTNLYQRQQPARQQQQQQQQYTPPNQFRSPATGFPQQPQFVCLFDDFLNDFSILFFHVSGSRTTSWLSSAPAAAW